MKENWEAILEGITKKITRDNKRVFTDMARLDLIKHLLEDSDYEIMKETDLSVIYKRKGVALSDRLVLISTHVDCVPGITKPDFKVTKKGNYKGTFDNAATNAAVVIAMLENCFLDDVIIAFTGDEERDQNGARQVIEFLEGCQKKTIAIALDVTFELSAENDKEITTFKNASFTIDNVCKGSEENIVKELFRLANDSGIKYMVTRAEDPHDYFEEIEDDIAKYYDEQVEVEGCAWEDEAIEYSGNKGCIGAFSLCLPTDDTEDEEHMHSNELIKIKRSSFHEYIDAVVSISNGLSRF